MAREGSFHARFAIPVGVEETRRWFVNRIKNQVFDEYFHAKDGFGLMRPPDALKALRATANALGEEFHPRTGLANYVKDDFFRCMRAVEGIHSVCSADDKTELDGLVHSILSDSELDLGVSWSNGLFLPTGAALLDEVLVNDQLRWLDKLEYKSVRAPFEKGLSLLLEAQKKPQVLSAVVTDMYESLEAMARIVTGNEKDLSANKELFISRIKASGKYKELLTCYIDYANEFRHAARKGREKPQLSIAETESFVYLTGLFLRLATLASQ
jgi:hypothetical protein